MTSASADALADLAKAHVDARRFDEAEKAARAALALDGGHLQATQQLANALVFLGRSVEALGPLRELHERLPEDANMELNLGMALLTCGDYAAGWRHYEARLRTERGRKNAKGIEAYSQPQWKGEPLSGKTLLLHREQGLGDTLQFLRFAPGLARSANRLIVRLDRKLAALTRNSFDGVAVIPVDGPLEPFDTWAAMMSLGNLLAIDLPALPGSLPYLRADSQSRARWRAKLAPDRAPVKIGIAWKGTAPTRSITLEALMPLFSIPGPTFYSLQFRSSVDEVRLLEDLNIGVPGRAVEPFEELAAFLTELDLIITIDGVVAHVAGGLGLPCWILLSKAADWRWLLGRADSPWYPSVRLFRQKTLGDWSAPIAKATETLLGLVRNARSR